MNKRNWKKIDADLRPPYSAYLERDEIRIANDNHVIAVIWVGGHNALPMAKLIAESCNKAAEK